MKNKKRMRKRASGPLGLGSQQGKGIQAPSNSHKRARSIQTFGDLERHLDSVWDRLSIDWDALARLRDRKLKANQGA